MRLLDDHELGEHKREHQARHQPKDGQEEEEDLGVLAVGRGIGLKREGCRLHERRVEHGRGGARLHGRDRSVDCSLHRDKASCNPIRRPVVLAEVGEALLVERRPLKLAHGALALVEELIARESQSVVADACCVELRAVKKNGGGGGALPSRTGRVIGEQSRPRCIAHDAA